MFRKLLSFLFIVLIVLGIGIEKVEAEPAEPAKPYTYSVEFDGGRYGEVYDESENAVSVISDIPYGSTFYRNGNNVTIVKPDHSELKYHLKQNEGTSKYYFKGFHVSGQVDDMVDVVPVEKDTILVATYGVSGSLTEYRVRYIDDSGKELAPTDVMYANVGDQPIVGCRYIAGYLPNVAMMQSVPLEKGVIQLFTFIYKWYGEDDVYIPLEPIIEYVYPKKTTVKPDTVEDEGEEIIEVVVEPEPAPAPTPAPAPAPDDGSETETEEIGNILTPLVNWIKNTMEENPVLGVAAIIGLVILGLGILFLLIFLILLLLKRRKKDDEKEERE